MLARAGLEINSCIEIDTVDGEVIIKPVKAQHQYTMEEMLSSSPARAFELDENDRSWLGSEPMGQEIL